MIPPNNNSDNSPMLNEQSLKRYADSEHETMKHKISKVVKEKHVQIKGSTSAQLAHDGATLVKSKNLQSIGL